MFTLIIGGSASGKSEYAEKYVMELDGLRVYLATMEPWDEECRRRIARHRQAREGRGFVTAECSRGLEEADIPDDANVLLEDLGNLAANEMFHGPAETRQGFTRDDIPPTASAILRGVDRLLDRCRHLTVVTNEIFCGGVDYAEGTLEYLQLLAHVNRLLARRADRVVEVVCALPVVLYSRTKLTAG